MRRRVFQLQNAVLRHLVVAALIILTGPVLRLAIGSAAAQSGDQGKPAANAAAADAAKDSQRKADEFVEAAQAINGPAGNPECVWLGRRVIILMANDDLDTAFRHLDLYDRFGCPGGHIQATFRCVARFGLIGPIDAKAGAELAARVHGCWINPAAQPQLPAAAATAAPQPTAAASAAATPAPAPPAQPAPAPPPVPAPTAAAPAAAPSK
jgi:hypothetical protein